METCQGGHERRAAGHAEDGHVSVFSVVAVAKVEGGEEEFAGRHPRRVDAETGDDAVLIEVLIDVETEFIGQEMCRHFFFRC